MRRAVANLLAWGGLLAGLVVCLPMISQETSPVRTNRSVLLPPLPPPPKPPTEIFRELLKASPAECEQILAGKPAEWRALMLSKLEQYKAMTPGQRELHLRSLELRWYLISLMGISPINRGAWLDPLPEPDRRRVADRLTYWDALPAGIQKEVLTNEMAIRIVVPSESGVPELSLTNLPPGQRQKIEASIAHWKSLPREMQQEVYWHFKQLFELPDSSSLVAATAAARQPFDKSLEEAFKSLPPAERTKSLAKFQQYLNLRPEQREEFRVGLKRWQDMSEQEREKWRQVVSRRPPLPPPPLPPSPPGFPRQARAGATVRPPPGSFATNK